MKSKLLVILLSFTIAQLINKVTQLSAPYSSPVTADDKYRAANVDFNAFMALSKEVQPHRAERLVDYDKWMALSRQPNTVILDTRSREAYDNVHINGAIHLDFSDFTDYKLKQLIPEVNTKILIYCANNFHGNSILTSNTATAGPSGPQGPTRPQLKGAPLGAKGPAVPSGPGPSGPQGKPMFQESIGPAGLQGPATETKKEAKRPPGRQGPFYPRKKLNLDSKAIQKKLNPPTKNSSSGKQNISPFKSLDFFELENKDQQRSASPVALNIPTYINLYFYGYKNVYELSSSIDTKNPELDLAGAFASFR